MTDAPKQDSTPVPPPHVLAEDVRRELGAERIMWAGLARPRDVARNYAWFGFLPFFYLCSVVVNWGRQYGTSDVTNEFWGTAVVLFMASLAPLCYGAWKARHTYYAVTGTRILMFERTWRSRFRWRHVNDLPSVERIDRGEGYGDLVFERVDTSTGANRVRWSRPTGFIGTSDVAGAEAAVLAAQDALRRVQAGTAAVGFRRVDRR